MNRQQQANFERYMADTTARGIEWTEAEIEAIRESFCSTKSQWHGRKADEQKQIDNNLETQR
jgi:hypothetical protein